MQHRGVYGGRGATRRLFSDLGDTLPDLRLVIERLEPVGCDRVLAFIRANATGRASGTAAGSGALSATGPDIPSANVYDLSGVAVNRLSPLRPCVLGAARTWQRDSSASG